MILKCRCTRCHNVHDLKARVVIKKRDGKLLCCPKCGCSSFV